MIRRTKHGAVHDTTREKPRRRDGETQPGDRAVRWAVVDWVAGEPRGGLAWGGVTVGALAGGGVTVAWDWTGVRVWDGRFPGGRGGRS